MAESAPSSLASGGQHDDHAYKPQFASTGLENQEEGDAREGDYDVETVERIYRFVITILSASTNNLPIRFTERLIAVLFLVSLIYIIFYTHITNHPQLSGSSTSSARPSGQTLESLRP